MEKPCPITHEQFKDAVRRLLFKKPDPSTVADDYDPTPEELEEIYRAKSLPKSDVNSNHDAR